MFIAHLALFTSTVIAPHRLSAAASNWHSKMERVAHNPIHTVFGRQEQMVRFLWSCSSDGRIAAIEVVPYFDVSPTTCTFATIGFRSWLVRCLGVLAERGNSNPRIRISSVFSGLGPVILTSLTYVPCLDPRSRMYTCPFSAHNSACAGLSGRSSESPRPPPVSRPLSSRGGNQPFDGLATRSPWPEARPSTILHPAGKTTYLGVNGRLSGHAERLTIVPIFLGRKFMAE